MFIVPLHVCCVCMCECIFIVPLHVRCVCMCMFIVSMCVLCYMCTCVYVYCVSVRVLCVYVCVVCLGVCAKDIDDHTIRFILGRSISLVLHKVNPFPVFVVCFSSPLGPSPCRNGRRRFTEGVSTV